MPKAKTDGSYGEKSAPTKRGKGPKKGAPNAGRRTKSLVHFLKRLRNDAEAQQALMDAARDSTSRNFSTAWKVLGDYDAEKPAEKREHSGAVTINVKMTREGPRRTAG